MFIRALHVFILASCAFHCAEAFCERLYKKPYWSPRTATQRAAEADIVIYGNVSESPCVKPTFLYRPIITAPTPSNATNSSSSLQPTMPTANSSRPGNITNITDTCLTRGVYNITLTVLCVIKGGLVPREIHLTNLGFGPEMCTYFTYGYFETVQSFHMYRGLTYVIFLGRYKGRSNSKGFWPHHVNLQFAAMEITNETFLKPIFEVVGGHAHSPKGMPANETRSICTPFIAGAGTNYMSALYVLLLPLWGRALMSIS